MTQSTSTRDTAVISVIDDDEPVRTALESLLRSNGYTVQVYADALEFLNSSGPCDTQCLISDIHMPGLCGIQMYEALIARGFQIPVIFITGYPGELPRINTDTAERVAYLTKPFQADILMAYVEIALNRHT